MHKDIHAYYHALGLSEGAGPAEIRRAYRHMVQTWHPDLFKPGSPMQMTAEDITKEVNEAYEQLYRKKLYRRFPQKEEAADEAKAAGTGEPAPGGDEGAAGTGEPARADADRRPPDPGPERPRWWGRPWDWKRFRPSLRVPWRWAAVAVGVCLAAYAAGPTVVGLLKRPAPDAEADARVLPEVDQPASPVPGGHGPAVAPERRAGEAPRSETGAPQVRPASTLRVEAGAGERAIRYLTSYDSIKDAVRPAPRPETGDLARLFEKAGALLEVFEVGDSKAKVLAVQGTPDDAGDTVFRYGSSLVFFERGRVTGWTDRVPWLHVRPWSERSLVSLDTFSLGSTRGDVIRAQGEPSAFTPRGYFYGSSYVYFENDVVAGWSAGDVNLRSFDIPVLPFLELDRMVFR